MMDGTRQAPGPWESLDLFLLIGQSNMAGRGVVEAYDRAVHPRVFILDASGEWVPASDPVHFDKPTAGVGPSLTFGKLVAEHDPGVRVGLIPGAVGGSSIAAWTPGAMWHETGAFPYDDALRRSRLAMEEGTLRAMLWHQGETEAQAGEDKARLYGERLTLLINRLRADLDAPDLPFIAGTLGDFVVTAFPAAQIINETVRKLPERVPRTACVETAGLTCMDDGVHFDSASARVLGRRYAEAYLRLFREGN